MQSKHYVCNLYKSFVFAGDCASIHAKLDTCLAGMGFLLQSDQLMYTSGLLGSYPDQEEEKRKRQKGEDYPLLVLEHMLLKMASALKENLCKGVLYILVLPADEENDVCVR